jgi:hypothetical protein
MRFALAILHAWIMMHISINDVFTSPNPVLTMYTSSSRTDSAMRTEVSPIPFRVTSAFETVKPSLIVGKHDVVERKCQTPTARGTSAIEIEQIKTFQLLPSSDYLCKLGMARPYIRQGVNNS